MASTTSCVPSADRAAAAEPVGSDGPRLRLVGPIEVTGIDRPLTSQQLSLVTYLACVGPAGREVLTDALWAGRPVSPGRFANVVSGARERLGPDRLPPARMGRYRVVDLPSDLDVLTVAGHRSPMPAGEREEGVAGLIDAIRGPVLGRPGERHWSWLDDRPELAAGLEAAVGRAAGRAIEDLMARGRLDAARVVCERALVCCPLDRYLTETLGALHRAQGRWGTAERLAARWRSRVAAAGGDVPPRATPG